MTETDSNDNLFPSHHHNQDTGFTEEEIEDIMRYAEVHNLNPPDAVRLVAFIRDVREAHTKRVRSKGEPTPWPTQKKPT